MRSLLLLCALSLALILVCNSPSRHGEASRGGAPAASLPSPPLATPVSEVRVPAPSEAAAKPSLLSLLTFGTAVLGALTAGAAESPLDANAQIALGIAGATAELEASAARIADARAR